MQGHLSVKADVYSFGVLILEILSGRKNMDLNLSHETHSLLAWVWESYKRGNVAEIIDPAIFETCDQGQALRCIYVGLLSGSRGHITSSINVYSECDAFNEFCDSAGSHKAGFCESSPGNHARTSLPPAKWK